MCSQGSRTAQPKEGDTIYAVRNGGLYKQSVSLPLAIGYWLASIEQVETRMSLSSSWMKAFYSAARSHLNPFYWHWRPPWSLRASWSAEMSSMPFRRLYWMEIEWMTEEQKLYKLFVTQIAASTWQSISERRWSQVFPHRAALRQLP